MTYPIPSAAMDDRFAIVGTTGSGKTYLASSAVEILIAAGKRVVVVDPLGVWWGLRLSEGGTKPSPYKPVIFGGSHGDLAINEQSGSVIGETVAGMAESCVLDLSQIGTKAQERRFMLAFLTALYTTLKGHDLVHVIFDEADMWAPQVMFDKDGDAARLLGMMETLVRRGRVKGSIPWLITQRPAALSKSILSQVDGLVALKLTSSQDRDAIAAWVEGQADRAEWKKMYAGLATMQRGMGIVWIPSRTILTTAQFPAKTTFDSSRTPKRGEAMSAAHLTPIDIGALKEKLVMVEDRAKADDPKTLKAEIARLKAESQKHIAAAPQGFTQKDIDAAKEEGFAQGFAHGDEQGYLRGERETRDGLSAAIANAVNSYKPVITPSIFSAPKPEKAVAVRPTTNLSPAPKLQPSAPPRSDLTVPQHKIMRSLVFWFHIGHKQPTREQVAAIAGYSPGSGNFGNILGQLKNAGLIDYPQPGRVAAVARTELYDHIDRNEARSILIGTLAKPHERIIEALVGDHQLSRNEIGVRTGYSASSGNFGNLLGQLRTIDIVSYPSKGMVALTDWAREVLA